MKKSIRIILTIVICLFSVSCGVIGDSSNDSEPDPHKNSVESYHYEQEQTEKILEKLIECFDNKDKEGIKALFSPQTASLILSQEHNIEHYLKNLDACIIEAECYVNDKNRNGMLESKSNMRLNHNVDAEGGLYVSCFANRGGNCPCRHGQVSLASKYACDWNLAIGEAFGSLQADVQYMGHDMYQMNYKYYIYDVYEWPGIHGLRDLHLHGVAHQYPIVGYISGDLIWKKGERCYNGMLAESAILELNNNLSSVKEFFREMDINSDNMREVLEFYGI